MGLFPAASAAPGQAPGSLPTAGARNRADLDLIDEHDTSGLAPRAGSSARTPTAQSRSQRSLSVWQWQEVQTLLRRQTLINHIRHTVRLINALIRACKAYKLLPFSDERHLP